MSQKQKCEEMINDLGVLQADRSNFDSQYEKIAQVCEPGSRGMFLSANNSNTGDVRTQDIFDSTPATSLQRFGSIMDSLITPRNAKWSLVQPSDPELLKDRQVELYFERANALLFRMRYAPTANFQAQNLKDWISQGAYGTSCLFTDELQGSATHGFRYKNIHLSEFWFTENHQGIPDKNYRSIKMTIRQMKQKWGDKLPDRVKNKKPNETMDIIHCVRPNNELDPNRMDWRGMDYYSCYMIKEDAFFLEEGGYTTFPYAISRYDQWGREIYGRSPAMMVMPAIRTLMQEKKDVLTAGHRANNPALLFADDGIMDGFSLKAGAMNSGGVSADGRPLVHAVPTGRVDIGLELMTLEKNDIKDGFLVSIFQILTESPEMTAYEVMERTREKGILLAPVVGRQHSEKLGPQIVREFDMISRWGMLGPMPGALREAKGAYDIIYDSPISRAAQSEEAVGFVRSVQSTAEIANMTQRPELLDIYDFDTALPDIAKINGSPVKWLSSTEKLMQQRQARSEQAQQEQAIQAAPSAVALAKTVNEQK